MNVAIVRETAVGPLSILYVNIEAVSKTALKGPTYERRDGSSYGPSQALRYYLRNKWTEPASKHCGEKKVISVSYLNVLKVLRQDVGDIVTTTVLSASLLSSLVFLLSFFLLLLLLSVSVSLSVCLSLPLSLSFRGYRETEWGQNGKWRWSFKNNNVQAHSSENNETTTRTRTHPLLSLIHIWRCRRTPRCRSRWSPYH